MKSTDSWGRQLLRQQRQPLNVPGKMMHRVGGCQNYAASRRKSQSHNSMPCDFQVRLALWRDFHNAAPPGKRRRDVEVANRVESQALRASQAAEKLMDRSLRINSVDAVEARSCGPGYK